MGGSGIPACGGKFSQGKDRCYRGRRRECRRRGSRHQCGAEGRLVGSGGGGVAGGGGVGGVGGGGGGGVLVHEEEVKIDEGTDECAGWGM